MTEISLESCDPHALLSHLALYGLGAILEAEGAKDVRLGWKTPANPRPAVSIASMDELAVAALVARHAQARNAPGSWVQRDITLKGSARGLMSPRLTAFGEDEVWASAQQARQSVLDELGLNFRWFDMRFLGALGEPSYWRHGPKGEPLQDDGASRFDMQPRNHGSEFVGTRLRKIAASVSAREPGGILAGLRGETAKDTVTLLDLSNLGPADSALAWCAMWGISQFPLAMRLRGAARTSGHIGGRRAEWFYAPMWFGRWRPARLRSVLASRFPGTLASSGLTLREPAGAEAAQAHAWLRARGIDGVMRFPIQTFGSASAPERRAMRGEPVSVRGIHE